MIKEYYGKTVKVIKEQGFATRVRPIKGKTFTARADMLKPSKVSSGEFSQRD